MIIKKFTGKTEEEAVALAKAELGEDIVIMNVKTIAPKGAFGFFRKSQTEVTVAREENNDYALGQRKSSEEASIRETFRQVAKVARTDDTAFHQPANEDMQGETHKILVEKLDSLHNMIEKKLQTEGEDSLAEAEPEEEEKEDSEMMRFWKLLHDTMLDNEVDEKYANQIIEEMEKNAKPNLPFDHALADVYQKMILKFGKASPIEKGIRTPRVIFFIGPTGVGKTTTIAKIASRFRVDQKQKIALLTTDTYRIAAAEQLRTYANILEVPFRVIYSVEDMQTAVLNFREYDFILVDMAGHSPHNQTLREDMKAFIECIGEEMEKEIHLVLSATTKYKDLIHIVDTYEGIEGYKIIFTKLDETTTLGSLLNLKLYTGAGLSYITCGQNVPDDIEVFNPQKTVKQLLGGKN